MAFNTNTPRLEFTASASQTVFDFNFKIFIDSDIVVYQTPTGQTPDDATDILIETTHYTVAIDGDDGGTVTLVSGATLNDSITLLRDLPFTRETDYQTGGDLLEATLDADQDYQTYLSQQLESSKDRFLNIPVSVQAVDATLPPPYADAYFKWNATANAIENDTTIPDAVTTSAANAAAALVSETNAAASEDNAAISAAAIGNMVNKDTIADLRLMTTTPSNVYVTGYNTKNDGAFGSHFFKRVEDTGQVDNGSTIIVNDAGVYELQYSGIYHAKFAGFLADGSDESAKVSAIETAYSGQDIDLDGLTIYTTLSIKNDLSCHYFNGNLFGYSIYDSVNLVKPTINLTNDSITRTQTKSHKLDWENANVLWLGTSIPGEGGDTAYPMLVGEQLKANVVNNAWAGSHARYDVNGDAFEIGTVKALSMTEDDRLAGLALYGATSAYDDSFDSITKASKQTCDYRIRDAFKLSSFDSVILDHNHNDRPAIAGTLTPDEYTISAITIGATTDITLSSVVGLAIGDSIALQSVGIGGLKYFAARIENIVGNNITLNLDTTLYLGAFTLGTVYLLDRTTQYGAWEFLIHYIYHCSIVYGSGTECDIVLCPTISEFTVNRDDNSVWHNKYYLQQLAQKWGLSFYDVTYDLAIDEVSHPYYFTDSTHPVELVARKAIATYWADWMSGGKKIQDAEAYLPREDATTFNDGYEARYNKYTQSFNTTSRNFTEEAAVWSDDFEGTLAQWVDVLGDSTIVASPMPSGGNALQCIATAAVPTAFVRSQSAFAAGFHPVLEFDFYLPEVEGLTDLGTTRTVTLALMEKGAANLYSLQLIIRKSSVAIRCLYYASPNVIGEYIGGYSLEKETTYSIKLDIVKASATGSGYILFTINGIVAAAQVVNNINNVDVTSIQLGLANSNTGKDLTVYIDNLSIKPKTEFDYSSRFTGTFTDNDLKTVTVVNGLITSVV